MDPSWREDFFFNVDGKTDSLTVLLEVYDEDLASDDFLGQYSTTITPNDPKFGVLQSQPLRPGQNKKNEKVTGTINFRINHTQPTRSLHVFDASDSYSFPNPKPTKILLGPILHFRGLLDNVWTVGAVVVVDGEGGDTPDLAISPAPSDKCVKVTKLLEEGTRTVFAYDFGFKQLDKPFAVTYTLNGKKKNKFYVPGALDPLKMTSTSCNGFHADEERQKLLASGKEEFFMWRMMLEEHNQTHFHLILQGGDQIYADPVWSTVTAFASAGIGAGDPRAATMAFTEEMGQQALKYYLDCYISSWKGDFISTALASIPSVMMWDDHDIFDGWGSYDAKIINSAVYQSLFKIAERAFCAFQLGCTPEKLPPATLPGKHRSKTQCHIINTTGILALDLRTERSIHQVMHQETYDNLDVWLSKTGELHHLVVVSSIPIVYNDFSTLEAAIRGTGAEIEDDLLDHWRAADHQVERLMILKKFLSYARHNKTRVTIISGDVHIGALGVFIDKGHIKSSNTAAINCLITSAMVNAPPPGPAIDLLELNALTVERINLEYKAGLVKFPPKHTKIYLRNRNFLELLFDDSHGIMCRWIVEDDLSESYHLYILPPTEKAKSELKLVHRDFLTAGLGKIIPGAGWFH